MAESCKLPGKDINCYGILLEHVGSELKVYGNA